MPHDPQKLIEDVRISIREINDFCDGKKFIDFESAPLLQRAIEREMEIIGEVLNRLIRIDEEKLEEVIPEYRSIVGLRNIIAHGYDVVGIPPDSLGTTLFVQDSGKWFKSRNRMMTASLIGP